MPSFSHAEFYALAVLVTTLQLLLPPQLLLPLLLRLRACLGKTQALPPPVSGGCGKAGTVLAGAMRP